jgi:hypothetical protein
VKISTTQSHILLLTVDLLLLIGSPSRQLPELIRHPAVGGVINFIPQSSSTVIRRGLSGCKGLFYFLFSLASRSSKVFYSLACKFLYCLLRLSGLTDKTEYVTPRFSVWRENRNKSSYRNFLLFYSVVFGMLRRCAKSADLAGPTLTAKYHRQKQAESFQPTENQ